MSKPDGDTFHESRKEELILSPKYFKLEVKKAMTKRSWSKKEKEGQERLKREERERQEKLKREEKYWHERLKREGKEPQERLEREEKH